MAALPRIAATLSHYSGTNYPASNCIDDDTTQTISGLCHSTGRVTDPYLEIELANEAAVDYVTIHNRDAACGSRLGAYEVWLGSTSNNRTQLCAAANACTDPSSSNCGTDACEDGLSSAGPFTTRCAGSAAGRYLTVLLPGSGRTLNLIEVYAYSIPSPPQLPPSPPAPVASLSGDPHAKGADGEVFDFRGQHNTPFCILSAANLSFSALFRDVRYHASWSKRDVEGSFIKAAFWVVRGLSRLVYIQFQASVAIVRENSASGRVLQWVKLGSAPFGADDVRGLRVSVRRGSTYRGHLCTVATRDWTTTAESAWWHPHAGVLRLRLTIQPRVAVARMSVAPHGLLGQTFDGDRVALFGRKDDYTRLSGVFRTKAQGEGAIEGHPTDYQLTSPFATHWQYSRFDARSARPRNISLLQRVGGPNVRLCRDLNLQGGDLISVPRSVAPTSSKCLAECRRRSQCTAFTHIVTPGPRRPCWLKKLKASTPQRRLGVVSGVVRGDAVGRCNVSIASER